MADKQGAAFGFGTPFEEQLAFFLKKLNLPTERWDDIMRSAHDRAFMVAGAAKADLLNDLRGAVQKRMADGKGLQAFRKEFKDIVLKHGWSGWTGEGSKAGWAWRTRIIYSTNMATSYAAGRWKQLTHPDLLKLRPFWQYKHADGVAHPRPMHVLWDGITLPYDHVFWLTHFAPNGWLCHCYIIAVDAKAYAAALLAGKGVPPAGWELLDPKTGAPAGIDKGFDYAPGANADTSLRQMVQDKLIIYPPAISKALSRDVNRYVNADQSAAAFARDVLADTQRTDPLWLGFVENVEEVNAALAVNKIDTRGYMVMLPADAPRHIQRHHQYDGAGQRLPVDGDYELMLSAINAPDLIQEGIVVGGHQRLVIVKKIGAEVYRWIFELRQGKHNRSLALVTLAIKTAK